VDGVYFRCAADGGHADRWLEVPAWMFERASCPGDLQLTAAPFVSLGALGELSALLDRALKTSTASSNAPLSGAFRSSHDQIRGEAHANDEADPLSVQRRMTPPVFAILADTTRIPIPDAPGFRSSRNAVP
jgi:hypothetical protein